MRRFDLIFVLPMILMFNICLEIEIEHCESKLEKVKKAREIFANLQERIKQNEEEFGAESSDESSASSSPPSELSLPNPEEEDFLMDFTGEYSGISEFKAESLEQNYPTESQAPIIRSRRSKKQKTKTTANMGQPQPQVSSNNTEDELCPCECTNCE